LNKEPALNRGLLLTFALPAIMLGFTHAPESSVQGIYAKHAGLSLSAFTGKSVAGIAGAAGLFLLDLLGFNATATTQTAEGAGRRSGRSPVGGGWPATSGAPGRGHPRSYS
jgi:Na+/melibiose symporter-like transporter